MWVFLSPKCCSSAACSWSTRSTAAGIPDAFAAASHELDILLGTINTAVLITSSLTMALAVHAAQTGERRRLMMFLVADDGPRRACSSASRRSSTTHKFVEHHVPGPGFQFEAEHVRHAQIFFSLYFVMTGLHALHMIIGLGIMTVMLWLGVARHDHRRVLQPDRDQRPLLALRRHRLDLPVPAALPDRAARDETLTWPSMQHCRPHHIVPEAHLLRDLRASLHGAARLSDGGRSPSSISGR